MLIKKLNRQENHKRNMKKNLLPDEMLKYEIQKFCTNLATSRKNNPEKGNRNRIQRYNKTSDSDHIKKTLRESGIYPSSLGPTKCKNYQYIISKKIEHDFELTYDKKMNKYYLFEILI